MNKRKLGFTFLGIGSLAFLICLVNGENKDTGLNNYFIKDTTFLVSLEGTSKDLGLNGVETSQTKFKNTLSNLIGENNFTVLETYEHINALKIKANESFNEVISSIKNVRKVSEDASYTFSEVYSGERSDDEISEGYLPYTDNYGDEDNPITEEDRQNNQSKETMNVPSENNGGSGSFVAILDSGFYIEHSAFKNFDTSETLDKAWDRFNYNDLDSITGLIATREKTLEGVTKDYQGELNDKSLYYNLKIPFYYDYGGSSDNSSNDYDVLSRISEHGTHVASITGANGSYLGIAPNTQLALMKVFYEMMPDEDGSSSGGVYATDSDILEALNDCVALGVDALNMSLGSDLNDFDDRSTSMDVLTKLTESGVACNIAAGNAGKGLFKSMSVYKDWATDQVDTSVLGSYSVSNDANIVASSTNPTQYYENAFEFNYIEDGEEEVSVAGYSDQVDYTDGSDGILTKEDELLLASVADSNGEVELVTAGVSDSSGNYYGTSTDYSTASSYDTNLFKGKVAVVDRGSTSFVNKAQAAIDAGCIGLIVINNDPTAIEFTFGMSWSTGDGAYEVPTIPVVFVLYRDRDTILNKVLSPLYTSVNGSEKEYARVGKAKIISKKEANNPDKDQLSDFSSDGGTSTLRINPTLSTPGSSIKGATLGKANSLGYVDDLNPYSYEYLNGTSMATPNYTGLCALMIGEQNFTTSEEREEYLKSITMRAMSTATQYEYTSTTYDRIKVSEAETTGDYINTVKIYTPVDENGNETSGNIETAPFSPRKQGAGVVNAAKALNSKVYLEGLEVNDDGSFSTSGNGFSKIELLNNDLIKEGEVKLGFRIHNPEQVSTTYKVKMTLMCPEVESYHNHDNELANYVGKDSKYEGTKLATSYDHVLKDNINLGSFSLGSDEVTKDVTLDSYTLTNEMKEYLEYFENGTYLEGYVYLEPVNESEDIVTLSMPFMGFYKDYGEAEATEKFNFEKEETYDASNANVGDIIGINGKDKLSGKTYGSDLVNTLGSNSYSRTAIDTSSTIAATDFDTYNTLDKSSSIIVNNDSISNFANELAVSKEDNETYTIYAGGDNTDVLYIQEFVYRSVEEETVQIIDSMGKTQISANVTDIINNGTNLYKSIISSSYISNYSLVHRGYLELPLYNTSTGARLSNGTYTLKFSYDLVYGATQTKTYNLVIDSSSPNLVSKVLFTSNGETYLRLKFSEIYIPSETSVHVNADITSFSLTKVSDGYLIDIPLSNALINDKLYVSIRDGSYNYTNIIINGSGTSLDDFTLLSNNLTNGSTYSYKVTSSSSGNINDTYTVSAKDYNGNSLDLGNYTAIISYDRKINSSVKVYGVNSNNENVSLKFELLDSTTIKIYSNSYTTFTITDNGETHDSISFNDNATIKLSGEVSDGEVYFDRESGRSGDIVTIYVVPNDGYEVSEVSVNGVILSQDSYGNYQFSLNKGENLVTVTFTKK